MPYKEVTVSIRFRSRPQSSGHAAGNMRFIHPDDCFIVEVMTKHGTIAAYGFHKTDCDNCCFVSETLIRVE